MNLLEIIVVAVLLLLVISGFRKGFVRKLASMVSLVVSIALVSLLLPHITEFLKERTPVYEYIVDQCGEVVYGQFQESAARVQTGRREASLGRAGTGKEVSLDSYQNMSREEIEELLQRYGYDSSVLDSLSDEELLQYKEQYLGEDYGQYIQDILDGADVLSLSETQQSQVIDSLPLPDFVKGQLKKYNNQEGYRGLNVSTFLDYIVYYVASAILNVVAFILSVFLVHAVLWIAIRALELLVHIPGINFLNRLAGGALGLLQGLFLLWLFFLALSLFEGTPQGQQILAMVQESPILSFVYGTNLFVQIVLRAAAIFV